MKTDGRGFESHPRQPILLWKMTVSGELCCAALLFCCVVVALPFLASLESIVNTTYLGARFVTTCYDLGCILL